MATLKWLVEIEPIRKGNYAKVSGRRGQEFRAATRRELFDQVLGFLAEIAGPDEAVPTFEPLPAPRKRVPLPPLEPVEMPPSRVVVRQRPGVRRPKRAAAR